MKSNDLISRSALYEKVHQCKVAINACINQDYLIGYASALSGVEGQIAAETAVDAEPVRHGRWIPKKVDATETEFQCSECGRTVKCGNDYFGKPTKHVSSVFPYCHCGAKMDAEVSE